MKREHIPNNTISDFLPKRPGFVLAVGIGEVVARFEESGLIILASFVGAQVEAGHVRQRENQP